MNREIKFRGKDKKGVWHYGTLQSGCPSMFGKPMRNYRCITAVDFVYGGWIWHRGVYWVKEETIGQYTGLNDKNGKKIFEGDIIKISPTNNFDDEDYCIYAVVRYGIYELYDEYSTMGFYLDIIKCGNNEYLYGNNIRHIDRSDNNYDECIVVGNIWDNPELLENRNECLD